MKRLLKVGLWPSSNGHTSRGQDCSSFMLAHQDLTLLIAVAIQGDMFQCFRGHDHHCRQLAIISFSLSSGIVDRLLVLSCPCCPLLIHVPRRLSFRSPHSRSSFSVDTFFVSPTFSSPTIIVDNSSRHNPSPTLFRCG